METIVKYLKDKKMTIATMESCTGGLLASLITDVIGASDVLKFSAVTYSTDFKIKMGVREDIINKYTVYSKEIAREMAYNITMYANSDIGVGITGRLVTNENANPTVNICIYNRKLDKYYDSFIKLTTKTRHENKLEVIEEFKHLFNSTIIF